MRNVIAAVALVTLALVPVSTQAPSTVPELSFESVPNPLTMPNDVHFGEVAGIAINSQRHIFVFSRGNVTGAAYMAQAAQLLEFDESGKFVREIGKNLFAWSYAHAVRIDRNDNIWVVDKGSNMIVKLNPKGRVEWVFGRKGESSHLDVPPDFASQIGLIFQRAGLAVAIPPNNNPRNPIPVHRDNVFDQPTDVAWDSRGNSFFSDGYVNSRVAKANARGEWVMSWGSLGSGPGQFDTPHGLAVSPTDEIYVADRGNRRVQVFDADGKYLREFTIDVPVDSARGRIVYGVDAPNAKTGSQAPGALDALCMTPGPNPVLFIGDLYPSRIYKVSLEGKVLGVYGQPGRNLGEFGWIHAIACSSEDEVCVGELINWRVQKLVTKGKGPAAAGRAKKR
jgi:hypothetical protein